MEFVKFCSLKDTYRTATLEKVYAEGLMEQCNWIVTEKIHGANFSFWCDGTEVKVASRTQFVDGSFYRCTDVIERYKDKVLDHHKQYLNPGDVLTIYGELYGDGIQKEVAYGPKDFVAFEIRLNGSILPYAAFSVVAPAIGIPAVKTLYVGSLEGALAFEKNFRSHYTPEGYEGENTTEGVVIMPEIPLFFHNGSRVMFKNKTEGFSERKAVEKVVTPLSEEACNELENVLQYATSQRVSNVISKLGEVTQKDFGKILGLTMKDIWEEVEKDGLTKDQLEDKMGIEWKLFSKTVQAEVTKVVRNEFLKSI